MELNVAQRMLDALALGHEVDRAEKAVLAHLREVGALEPDEPAHVEYGCVEFGVVHVNGAKRGWIELDPANPTIVHFL